MTAPPLPGTVYTVVEVRDLAAERGADTDEPVWLIEMSTDGKLVPTHGHGFPHSSLHWRAAEYGIDPHDLDTLLDVVLCEPHMNVRHTDPMFLYNTDEETARNAHLARVADVRTRVMHADPGSLLNRIGQAYDPGHPSLEQYRAQVHDNRRSRVATAARQLQDGT